MSVRAITAKYECDGCGSLFEIHLDPAMENIPSLFAAAENELTSSLCFSKQADLHLCQSCTDIADNIGEEEYQPSRDEILEAIGNML